MNIKKEPITNRIILLAAIAVVSILSISVGMSVSNAYDYKVFAQNYTGTSPPSCTASLNGIPNNVNSPIIIYCIPNQNNAKNIANGNNNQQQNAEQQLNSLGNGNASNNINQQQNADLSQSSQSQNNSFHSVKDIFVTSNPQGYGLYEERKSSIFQPGEDILLYIEPVGFAYKNLQDKQGRSLYSVYFDANFVIYDKNGNNLTDITHVPINKLILHSKNKEIFIPFTITQDSPFPIGDYTIKYTIIDKNTGNTFDIVKKITISN